jgi:NADPH-dependent glutamate synthase beta subunit-like oxidoreductase
MGNSSDIKRSAGVIMSSNPLGGVCGLVCPDSLCMAACARKNFDGSINIPRIQASIVEQAKHLGGIPKFDIPKSNGRKVGVIGGGPAGIGAAAALGQMGYTVEIFEKRDILGGMMNLIPEDRLDKNVLETDMEFALSLGQITAKTGQAIENPKSLFEKGFDAVCVTTGLWKPIELGIENEDLTIKMVDFLSNPGKYHFSGRVAVVGGGATAVDCALVAKMRGATHVEMFTLEKLAEMPLTTRERDDLLKYDIEITGRTRVRKVLRDSQGLWGIKLMKVHLPAGKKFNPKDIIDVEDLPAHFRTGEASNGIEYTGPLFSDETIIPFEKLKEEAIRHALSITEGNIVEAAKKLQLGRATIYRLMEKYKIENRTTE